MDGDHSAKAMDRGAQAGTHVNDLTEGLHESASNKPSGLGDKTTGHGTSMFSKDGALGKQFTEGGALGGTAQKIGGPFDKDGAIGKAFTTEGSLGGTAQNLANKNEQH